MASLLRTISDKFTSTTTNGPSESTTTGLLTAKTSTTLFPPTDPSIDGDECLHDCQSCSIKYPRKFSIDEDDALYGQIKGWARHVLVATGKTDWVRAVEDEKHSVMQAVGKHGSAVTGGRLMLSASNIPVPDEHAHDSPYGADRPTRILLLPSFQWVDGVTPNLVPQLITSIINTAPTNTQSLTIPQTPSSTAALDPTSLPPGITLTSCPHKYLILLCSQATRDARCGQSAPLLRKELERHLRPLGLYRDITDERPGGVGIYFISHVGGHKYSANVMVYRKEEAKARSVREQMDAGVAGTAAIAAATNANSGEEVQGGEAAQCIWLARIRPEDCENLVRFTVLQGKVVKPESQLRGGFDRERGVASW